MNFALRKAFIQPLAKPHKKQGLNAIKLTQIPTKQGLNATKFTQSPY